MMRTWTITAFFLLLATVMACALASAIALSLASVQRILNVVADASPIVIYAITAALISAVVAGSIYLIGSAVAFVSQRWHRRKHIPVGEDGSYPLIPAGSDLVNHTPPAVLMIKAWTHAQAQHGLKPTAAATGRAITALQQGAVVDGPYRSLEPAPALESLPSRISIYDADMTEEPALPVGIDQKGEQVILSLHNLGNVIIGGLPGYGKTELLGSFIAACLRQDPEGRTISLAVIDPKRADFALMPATLAALRYPVARDSQEALAVLRDLRRECDRRFRRFEHAGAKHLRHYNRLSDAPLPYIVALVDEWANFMNDEAFNAHALYLARMGRAAGISLVLATQRPSARVVSSDVRAMAGAAVAFRCRSAHDSRAIIDSGEAADLPSIPGRCIVARGNLVKAHAYACDLDGGAFDSFIANQPQDGARRFPTVPSVPVPALEIKIYQDEQEQERERKWEAFACDFLDSFPRATLSDLARAMANHEDRPDDWPNYKSEAHRRWHEYRRSQRPNPRHIGSSTYMA